MSKRKETTLGEFGFSKKVCHRDGEVDVIIPELIVEEEEIVKRIQCLHCSDKFVKKNFSLRLLLNCSYFSSDFSLDVLIKFVLIKKKECSLHFWTVSANATDTSKQYPLFAWHCIDF